LNPYLKSVRIKFMKKILSKSLTLLAFLVFIAVCVALYFYIYTIPSITGALTQTVVLEHDAWDINVPARCIIVRDETVIRAEESGTVSYYAKENVKERKGSKAADVYPSGGTASSYTMAETGVVSYYIDGYESYFTLENAGTIDPAWAADLDITAEDCSKSTVSAGDPLYKVINSDVWQMALMMDPADAAEFSQGQKIVVSFGEADSDQITGTVLSVESKGTRSLVIAQTRLYYEPSVRVRTTDVTILSRTYEGLTVPDTAIGYDEEGHPGVMVCQIDGSYTFTRINILRDNGEYSLISQGSFTEKNTAGETVSVPTAALYDEVLRNAEDGQ